MKILNNENGIALVTSLLFTLISLGIVMAVLYFLTQGISLTAKSKRYRNVLAASHGGVEVFTKEFIPRIFEGYSTSKLVADFEDSGIGLAVPVSNACIQQKLTLPTSAWSACASGSASSNPKEAPDMTFQLQGMSGDPEYNIYSKVVDTVPGNSDPSGIDYLDSGAGVVGGSSGVNPMHIPAKFRVEVSGERVQNAREKANLSVLYAY
jgi:hypothetical protein